MTRNLRFLQKGEKLPRRLQAPPRDQGVSHFQVPLGFHNVVLRARKGDVLVEELDQSREFAREGAGLFEQVEIQYGPDERPIKLAATADLRLGKAPRLDGVISARAFAIGLLPSRSPRAGTATPIRGSRYKRSVPDP